MVLLPNLGSSTAYRTGAIYRLVWTATGWKLVNGRGQHYTARGSYQFVRVAGIFRVSKNGEHVHITAGRPVEYAGQIRFGYNRSTKGQIRHWSNGSGHYKPPPSLAAQAGLPMDRFVEERFF
jgi:hypothetical protein